MVLLSSRPDTCILPVWRPTKRFRSWPDPSLRTRNTLAGYSRPECFPSRLRVVREIAIDACHSCNRISFQSRAAAYRRLSLIFAARPAKRCNQSKTVRVQSFLFLVHVMLGRWQIVEYAPEFGQLLTYSLGTAPYLVGNNERADS
jgi:hypothetical protein